jgi:hypothetical protein
MKSFLLFSLAMGTIIELSAQKTVQELQPARVSVFKNGSYFVKKSAAVQIANNLFSIPFPTNVLMGSFWLSTGKGTTVKSIVFKRDTVQQAAPCKSIADYLSANLNKEIILYRNYSDKEVLTGTLLDYNEVNNLVKIRTSDKKMIIARAMDFDRMSFSENGSGACFSEKIKPVATVHVNENISGTTVSTLSLQNGIQWVPSYLLSIINDQEASLSMKATIVNRQESLLQTEVDIVIGNPEMFYGKTMDPICFGYLNNDMLAGKDNNTYGLNMANYTNGFSQTTSNLDKEEDKFDDEKDLPDYNETAGDKMEDLYVYKLGKQDLEKDATVLIPVLTTTVRYEDIYSIDLPYNSALVGNQKILDVFHQYRITNNTTAPFTTGSVLVVNASEMPVAQAQLKYTPVNDKQEINLSKAIDVPVKNEETETKREKAARKLSKGNYADKVSYSGVIKINNLQNKKITITVTKAIEGVVLDAGDNGTIKKIKDAGTGTNSYSHIKWEITLNPNEKKELFYNYTVYDEE